MNPGEALLFVYGTLRPGFSGPMAAWLASVAEHGGRATARGALYRVDYYPAFVPGGQGQVVGDLMLLRDAAALLPVIDAHEECTAEFPMPHEYRRERLIVESMTGPVEAWTYVYARPVDQLERIEGGDFMRV
ncbi:gamma-glutamylcyclotransferase family protein [Sphingobium mellinum]|uniref:gamma-glutamylcyclotransferase family protein n=1 Tax=Sphingobium mellinum TaxID=1387166 RepID=UPI0030ECE0C7